MTTTFITILAVIGLLIASYFTSIAYRWIKPDARWIPSFCRLDERTCASIVFTSQARVFGPPNSLLGQLYYLALIIGAGLGSLEGTLLYTLMTAGVITIGLACYLSYSLLFVLRVPCKLCFTSHGLNMILFLLLWSEL